MRVLVQRVTRAAVRVGQRETGRIEAGLLALVGFTHTDGDDQLAWMADKLIGLRVFADDEDKMNRSVADIGGGLLVVSQFTLYGDAVRGRRPSFVDAAPPAVADHCTIGSWRCCANEASRSRRDRSARRCRSSW